MKTKRPNWSQVIPVIVMVLFIPSLLLNAYFISKDKKPEGETVVKVIDGDTFEIKNGQRIRLRQVDAPDKGGCGYEESTAFLKNLIEGQNVRIEETAVGQQNRPLALLYLDNKLVNLEILSAGWGRYHSDTSSKKDELQTAANKAKKERIGIFGPECYGKTPDNPNCTIKGNIDKSTDSKIYYSPGCPQYEFTIVEKDIGEAWFCTAEEAEAAGYVKAKNCPEKP